MKIKRNWHLSLAALALLAGAPAARTAETSQEAANKKLVLDFYNELYKGEAAGNLKDQIAGIAEKYVLPDYIQHNPVFGGPGGGRDAFVRAMQQQPSSPPNPNFKPPEIIAVMAEGERVMLFTKRELPGGKEGQPAVAYIFNMFRIHDGKLAEHWDAGAGAPPPGGRPVASAPRSDGAVRRPYRDRRCCCNPMQVCADAFSAPFVNSSDGVRFELLFTLKEKLLVRRNPQCRVSEIRKSLLSSS